MRLQSYEENLEQSVTNRKDSLSRNIAQSLLTPSEKTGLSRIEELSVNHKPDWHNPITTPKFDEVFQNDPHVYWEANDLPIENKEIIYILGETKEGIKLLEDTIIDYYNDLVEKQEQGKLYPIFQDKRSIAANLAMIRLVELYEQGKYYSTDTGKVLSSIESFISHSEQIYDIIPLPSQFGLSYFWKTALQNPSTSDLAWRITLENCQLDLSPDTHTQGQKDKIFYITNALFKAANSIDFLTQGQIQILSNYVFGRKRYGNNEFNDIHNPDLFITVIKRYLEDFDYTPYLWGPDDVKTVLSKDGVTTKLFELIKQYPDKLPEYFRLLYESILWCPEDEYELLTRKVSEYRKSSPFLLTEDDVFSCLGYREMTKEDTKRYMEWYQFIGPDITIYLSLAHSRYDTYAPDQLQKITDMYHESSIIGNDEKTRAAGIWLPLNGERLLQTFIDHNNSIPFTGNLIIEVQNKAIKLGASDSLNRALAIIHEHLHVSEYAKAAVYIRGLYAVLNNEKSEFEGINFEDISKITADPELKSELDIIRIQTCPELTEEESRKYIKSSIDYVRVIGSKNSSENNVQFKKLLFDIENQIQIEVTPVTVINISRIIKEYRGEHKGYLFPIILALRKYVLDNGIETPDSVTQKDWQETAITLAVYTGELSQTSAYILKRLKNNNPKRAFELLMQELRKSYAILSQIKDLSRIKYKNDEVRAIDTYRAITSRSLIDFIYRFTQENLLQTT